MIIKEMNKHKIGKIVVGIVLSCVLFFPNKVSASSIGISPSQITVDALLPGLATTKQIVISRADVSTDEQFLITTDPVEGGTWLSFLPGTEITMPKGEARAELTVKITVPEGVAYKRYLPKIHIVQQKAKGATGVSIQSGLVVSFDLLVTDKQVMKLSVLSAKVLESYAGSNLKLSVVFQNDGNVKTAPSKVSLAIRTANGVAVTNLDNTTVDAISPQATEEKILSFDTSKLPVGEYLAKLTVLDTNGKEIYSYDLFFRITAQPTPPQVTTGSIASIVGIIDLVLIVVIILFLLFLKLKSKRSAETSKP